MSTPPEQLPRRLSSVGEVLQAMNGAKVQGTAKPNLDPRMAKILASEQQKFEERQARTQVKSGPVAGTGAEPLTDGNGLQGLDPRMRRKLEEEQRRFDERQATQKAAPVQISAPSLPPVETVAFQSARKTRVAGSLKSIGKLAQSFASQEKEAFPTGSTRAIMKATDRTLVGNGPLFKPVLRALALVESSPLEPNLATLETAAKAYLADYERRAAEAQAKRKEFKPDKITATKEKTCSDALEKIRKLRAARDLQAEAKKLPTDGGTPEQEAAVNRVKAKMLIEAGGSKQLGEGESGASESFFLSDPESGEKSFIFKPGDGEFDAGYGWKKGGGAPREVMLSAVNDAFKNGMGLDCGVSTTTLAKVNHASVATERNGKKTERVGAIQNFVKSDRQLTEKLEKDPKSINDIPAEDIEKVALLDFATLQMDRQASNLLVHKDDSGKPRLIPIDAGNALPSRKAFEASRRMFGNNAVLGGDEAKKPFSPAMLKQIQAMDEKAIVASMKKANADMAAIDPQAASQVDDENVEIARRSMRFLKKAAPQLTKAQIADAYAYEFHKVLDAKSNDKDIDAAIDAAIKATLDKPGKVDAIDKFPEPQKTFARLGWPPGEYNSLLGENPARLLDILQKSIECQATLDEIQQMIAEVGIDKFDPDPRTTKDVGKRRIDAVNDYGKAKDAKTLAEPDLDRKMKSVGAEFIVIDAKGNKKLMGLTSDKVKLANQVGEYTAAKGDEALKRLGKDPAKLTFPEKYFELLGGDAKIADLKRKNLNPYDGPRLDYKIGELAVYKEYAKLGGDEEYVRLGCPQNKEITLDNRVEFMKQKRKLR